jgi:hypothetical protein
VTAVPNGHLARPLSAWHDAGVEWAQVATIVTALAAFMGLQTLWISHALDRVYARFDGIDARLDRIDARLGDHAERISRLEAAHGD